jgi:hypothetical protein
MKRKKALKIVEKLRKKKNWKKFYPKFMALKKLGLA